MEQALQRQVRKTLSYLQLTAVRKDFGSFTALRDINLEVAQGEFVCFLGPSGCGKTTLLRIIAGLEAQSAGTVRQGGRDISRLPPAQRDYGIVFQSYALFPNLSVFDNVAYGLVNRKAPRKTVGGRVTELLKLVGLPDAGAKYPSQLSGGQQQRIALARALATSPGLLLLDEPLSALDAHLRIKVQAELKRLQQRLGISFIYVTHNQSEAFSMADRVVVMNQGRIEQIGTPQDIFVKPQTRFVAEFLGGMNVLPARLGAPAGDGTVRVETDFGASWSVTVDGPPSAPGPIWLGIRPESLRVEPPPADAGGWNQAAGVVTEVGYLGAVARYQIEITPGVSVIAEVHDPDFQALRRVGDAVRLWCDPAKVRILASLPWIR